MALDDDAFEPGKPISSGGKPQRYELPDDEQIEPTIVKVANDFPMEDQFFIRRALFSRGYKVSQTVVDDVLEKNNLHNLRRGSWPSDPLARSESGAVVDSEDPVRKR